MSKSRVIVTAVLVEGRTKSQVARDYGVSRRWVQKLIARYQLEGEGAFEPASRRPRTNSRQIPTQIAARIVQLRKQLDELGVDCGAVTIAVHLERETGAPPPALSTIWRVLSRNGFVTPQPRKRPKSSYVRFAADQPNEMWQADFTHWHLADRSGVEILNFIDDHSRLALASVAYRVVTGAAVVDCFREICSVYGLPASVLTDNGNVFTARFVKGRNAFETELHNLRIVKKNSRPYHPQTCGKVERFQQTLKKWLRKKPPAETLRQLQTQLDAFIGYYNTIRPHRSLNRMTPATAYAERPKLGPGGSTPSAHFRVRTDKVDRDGKLTLRHNGRLHHIGIGAQHKHVRIRMLIDDLHIRVITIDGELIRELLLDPTRDYQPTGKTRYPKTPPP